MMRSKGCTAMGPVVCLLAGPAAPAASVDLGNGFMDHGVATPISNHRGTVATKDGAGRNVVLLWLYDTRGGYALLMIDAETGKADQVPMPFPPGGDGPFAAILSSANKFYTHFNSHFCEFDPVQRKFTFFAKSAPQMSMGMTEDDQGVIWSVTYPNSGVVSFDPKTQKFRDYGHVYKQNWAQYQCYVACDDAGWLYFGIGSTSGQLIALDPQSGAAKPIVADADRVQGTGFVYRRLDGKVYGHGGNAKQWYELHRGEAKPIGEHKLAEQKPIVTSSQALFHRQFPDGKVLKECNLVDRKLSVEDPKTKEVKTVDFDYTSEGAHIMGVCAAPDGTLCGGTAFPMRFFSYNPVKDEWVNRPGYGQFNTVATYGDRFFVGGYGHGFLLEWDPAQPWVNTVKGKPCNPQHHFEASPDINRPHGLVANDKLVVMAGTPGYGYTGGGLLIWDRAAKQGTVLKHAELIPNQAPMSLVFLPANKLLVGTTISAGTGGEVKATEAQLFVLDLATKKMEWHATVLPGARNYTDLRLTPEGLVYGIVDGKLFFVFDPASRQVVHQKDLEADYGRSVGHQGTRAFLTGPDKTVYLLLQKGIATVTPKTFAINLLVESPVPLQQGGDIVNGRLYFIRNSHLYSWKLPAGK